MSQNASSLPASGSLKREACRGTRAYPKRPRTPHHARSSQPMCTEIRTLRFKRSGGGVLPRGEERSIAGSSSPLCPSLGAGAAGVNATHPPICAGRHPRAPGSIWQLHRCLSSCHLGRKAWMRHFSLLFLEHGTQTRPFHSAALQVLEAFLWSGSVTGVLQAELVEDGSPRWMTLTSQWIRAELEETPV